jgi:hypothetical protein
MSEAATGAIKGTFKGKPAGENPIFSAARGNTRPVGQPAQPAANQSEHSAIPDDIRLERSRVAPGLYKPVPEITVFEWVAPSRPFKKRQRQFFVTVTVIALLVSMILFFSGQFLPIAVVISVVFLLYVLQVIPPQDIKHTITTHGISVEGNLYYWQELGRFWFEKKHEQLLLNIETARFPGRVTLVFPAERRQEVTEILSEVLLEHKPDLTLFEKIAAWVQEKIPLE